MTALSFSSVTFKNQISCAFFLALANDGLLLAGTAIHECDAVVATGNKLLSARYFYIARYHHCRSMRSP